MKYTCPSCGMENAAFDTKLGMYVCPDCGHEWVDEIPKGDKEDEDKETGTGD